MSNTFRPGDIVRNACDVAYPGLTGPYGYAYIAQSADDLKRVVDV